mmetsp:Transcript_2047/g.7498  ORF Transcript_2047/g.7498 Transcript_2047/m.7498 type:complete len:99 (-) Transcript_2047:915-1211(-)
MVIRRVYRSSAASATSSGSPSPSTHRNAPHGGARPGSACACARARVRMCASPRPAGGGADLRLEEALEQVSSNVLQSTSLLLSSIVPGLTTQSMRPSS